MVRYFLHITLLVILLSGWPDDVLALNPKSVPMPQGTRPQLTFTVSVLPDSSSNPDNPVYVMSTDGVTRLVDIFFSIQGCPPYSEASLFRDSVVKRTSRDDEKDPSEDPDKFHQDDDWPVPIVENYLSVLMVVQYMFGHQPRQEFTPFILLVVTHVR